MGEMTKPSRARNARSEDLSGPSGTRGVSGSAPGASSSEAALVKLGDEVAERIKRHRPIGVSDRVWKTVGPFVRKWEAEAIPLLPGDATDIIQIFARHC